MALIHTCYRITDIDRSVAFYEALGFQEVGRLPIRDEAINVFMNQPGDGDMPRLELTFNHGVDSYELGTAYGHIAIGVPDVAATCNMVREKASALGGAITREAGPVKGGTTIIAFITDPDGYKIELIQRDA